MFSKYIINSDTNLFNELSTSIDFEDIAIGRKGAILIDNNNDLIPIVRTTTNYNKPAQKFKDIHYKLIDMIRKVSKNDNLKFNNAMIELYDSRYKKMRYHTDQSLDLEDNSYICIFSCYDDNSTTDIRKLKVKNKLSNDEFEFSLEHNSLIMFSIDANKKHQHKIILDKSTTNKKWLGITFRLSKTYIKFYGNVPYFYQDNIILNMATHEERKQFMKLKGLENSHVEYTYPKITYTISSNDLMQIKE